MSSIAESEDVKGLFLKFVSGRHQVFERRMSGLDPWTWAGQDPILNNKFTNVFRINDRGSQFLLKELLYDPEAEHEDIVMRAMLYRYTNKPEPWLDFYLHVGRYPILKDLFSGRVGRLWRSLDYSVFNPCYKILVPLKKYHGLDKVTMVTHHVRDMVRDGVVSEILVSRSLKDIVETLQRVPGIGPFMSMQIATDIGYSPIFEEDWENDYIVSGPGSKRGAAIYAPDQDPVHTIWTVQQHLNTLQEARGLPQTRLQVAPGVWRTPSLMDIQNCFCEFQKYMRIHRGESRGTSFKQKSEMVPKMWYPGKWSTTTNTEGKNDGISSLIERPRTR
jgi:hypothetical protein